MSTQTTSRHWAFQDLTGKQIHGWIAHRYLGKTGWEFFCPRCGTKKIMATNTFNKGYATRCECVDGHHAKIVVSLLEPAFGNWLAGFIDGEGCFIIGERWSKNKKSVSHYLNFHIGLRIDDKPILEEIYSKLRIGVIRETRQNKNKQARWKVFTRRDCFLLVQLLDNFPLRAKKLRDYCIWREASFVWSKVKRLSAKSQKEGEGKGLQRELATLRKRLQEVREYKED